MSSFLPRCSQWLVAEANLIMDENRTVRKARPKSAGKGGKNTQKSYAGQKRTRPNKKDGLNKKKVLKKSPARSRRSRRAGGSVWPPSTNPLHEAWAVHSYRSINSRMVLSTH